MIIPALVLSLAFPASAGMQALAALEAASQRPAAANLEELASRNGAAFTGGRDVASACAAGIQRRLPPQRLGPPGGARAERGAIASSRVPLPSSASERRVLKTVRAVGAVAALAGLGLFVKAGVAVSAGPVGWAAALVFFGGLGAYLAHRRLRGHDDFSPSP